MEIESAPIAELRPDPDNPRRMNRHEADSLRRSLTEYGAVEPAVVNSDGTIIGGHMRVEAAKLLGWEEFPVVRVDLPEAKAKALNLALNRISGEWDEDKLAELMYGLDQIDHELAALTGFAEGEVQALLDSVSGPMKPPPDPKPPAAVRTKPGDLYELGNHRLLCGDATDPGAYEVLMAGAPARCVFTDPPYGVDVSDIANLRADRAWEEMAGDEVDDAALEVLLTGFLEAALEWTDPGSPLYLCHAEAAGLLVRRCVQDAGWRFSQVLVWAKDTLVMGRSDYQWRHEPILYGWKPGRAHRWYGGRNKNTVLEAAGSLEELGADDLRQLVRDLVEEIPGTVLRFARPSSSVQHPTMKPVELVARLLRNSSKRGEVVLDPFAGAGSTLLAAEQLSRHARCLELEPRFCDVIVDRWEEMTGRKAKLQPKVKMAA